MQKVQFIVNCYDILMCDWYYAAVVATVCLYEFKLLVALVVGVTGASCQQKSSVEISN